MYNMCNLIHKNIRIFLNYEAGQLKIFKAIEISGDINKISNITFVE